MTGLESIGLTKENIEKLQKSAQILRAAVHRMHRCHVSVLSHAHAARLLVFTLESGSVVEATIPDSSDCPARIYSTTKFYPAPGQGSQTSVDFLDLADVKSVLYGQRLPTWHSMRIVMRDGREFLYPCLVPTTYPWG